MWTHKLSLVLFVVFISFIWADARPLNNDEDSLNDDDDDYPYNEKENQPDDEPTEVEFDMSSFFDKLLDGQDVTEERKLLAEYRKKHPLISSEELTRPPPVTEPEEDIEWEY